MRYITEDILYHMLMENLNLVQKTKILMHLSVYLIKPNSILKHHSVKYYLTVRWRYLNVH